jgi:hypothetical protein
LSIKVGDSVQIIQTKEICEVVEVANPYMFDYPIIVKTKNGTIMMFKEEQLC